MTSEESLLSRLGQIEDIRKDRGIRYKLCDLLLMILYGILSGYMTSVDIVFFIELNSEYFNKLLGIERIPSHDTISRILRITDFNVLSEILNDWLDEFYPEIRKKYGKYSILHVDGKAVRAATEKSNGQKPVYLLNAMYEGGSIRVYSKQIGDKENEITKLPSFLSTFNLEDTIVTVDAMGDNNTVIQAIVEKKGEYLTIVKENQKKLLKVIEDNWFGLQDKESLDSYETIEKHHGRIETYRLTLLPNTKFIYDQLGSESFYGTISTVGVLEKTVKEKESGEWMEETTVSYLICSLEGITAEKMLEIKRSHWNIEMQHWMLDVEFDEDRYTARKDNAIQNMSAIKRFAMRIKKSHPEFEKLSLNRFFFYNAHKIENCEKTLFG